MKNTRITIEHRDITKEIILDSEQFELMTCEEKGNKIEEIISQIITGLGEPLPF